MAGPSVVQVANIVTNNAALTVTFGSAPTNGNLLVAMLFYQGAAPATDHPPSSGWHQETFTAHHAFTTDESVIVYSKVAGASESTSQTPATVSATAHLIVWEVTGAAATFAGSLDAQEVLQVANATSVAVTALTASGTNELALLGYGGRAVFAGAPTISGATFTQDKTTAGAFEVGGGAHKAVASGSSGSPTLAWPSSSGDGVSYVMLLLAAGGTAGNASYAPGSIALTAPAWSATGLQSPSTTFAPGSITLTAPTFTATGGEDVATTFAPGSIALTAPTFGGVGGTGVSTTFAPGSIALTAPAFVATITAAAKVAEADVAALAAPATHAKVAEADVAVPLFPLTHAKVAEADIAVVATPSAGTHGKIVEVDVAALVYIGPCATHRCQVWKITRLDGQVFAFTSLDRDVLWGDVTYRTCKSLTATAAESASDLHSVGNVELTGILDDAGITEGDLYGGQFDDAFVEVWVIPYDGLGDDQAPFRVAAGNMGKVTRGEHNFVAEVVGPGARLQQAALVDFFIPGCRWDFGDANCGIDAEARKIAAVPVTGSIGRNLVKFTASDPGGSIWNSGKVVWLTGRNAGTSCQVETVDFAAEALSLWDLAPYPPAIGDTFDLLPGCPLTKAGCVTYANYLRFGGFPDVPGPDALQSNADSLFTG